MKRFVHRVKYISIPALLAIVVWSVKDRFELREFIGIIQTLSLRHILIFFIISIALLLMKSFSWMLLLNNVNAANRLPFRRYLLPTMASDTLNLILPAKGGEMIRFVYLRNFFPLGVCFGSVLFERLIAFLILVIMSLTGSLLTHHQSYFASSAASLFIFVSILIASLNKCFLRSVAKLATATLKSNKIASFFSDYEAFSAFLKKSHKTTIFFIMLSIVQWLLALFQFHLMFLFLGATPGFLQIAVNVPIGILISLIPISIGGLGTREVAFIVLFKEIIDIKYILAFSLLFFAFRYILPGMMGILPLFIIQKGERATERKG